MHLIYIYVYPKTPLEMNNIKLLQVYNFDKKLEGVQIVMVVQQLVGTELVTTAVPLITQVASRTTLSLNQSRSSVCWATWQD